MFPVFRLRPPHPPLQVNLSDTGLIDRGYVNALLLPSRIDHQHATSVQIGGHDMPHG